MDFYLPASKIAFEIQGPHHYESPLQQERDNLKRALLELERVTLYELSIFQLRPSKLYNRLLAFSRSTGVFIGLRGFTPAWLTLNDKIRDYKLKITSTYGEHMCHVAPTSLLAKEVSVESYTTYATILLRGKEQRVRVLERQGKKFLVRVVGSTETILVKPSKLKNLG